MRAACLEAVSMTQVFGFPGKLWTNQKGNLSCIKLRIYSCHRVCCLPPAQFLLSQSDPLATRYEFLSSSQMERRFILKTICHSVFSMVAQKYHLVVKISYSQRNLVLAKRISYSQKKSRPCGEKSRLCTAWALNLAPRFVAVLSFGGAEDRSNVLDYR